MLTYLLSKLFLRLLPLPEAPYLMAAISFCCIERLIGFLDERFQAIHIKFTCLMSANTGASADAYIIVIEVDRRIVNGPFNRFSNVVGTNRIGVYILCLGKLIQ